MREQPKLYTDRHIINSNTHQSTMFPAPSAYTHGPFAANTVVDRAVVNSPYTTSKNDSWKHSKSGAAKYREEQAKRLFHAFLHESAKGYQQFPITRDVVPPELHLTANCWKSFKEYVVEAGCMARRREVQGANTTKSYCISITLPTHPARTRELAREKKMKKAAADQMRKELAIAKALQKRGEEVPTIAQKQSVAQDVEQKQQGGYDSRAVIDAKAKREFDDIVAAVTKNQEITCMAPGTSVADDASDDNQETPTSKEDEPNLISPAQTSNKKRKWETSASRDDLLRHLQEHRSLRQHDIAARIEAEKAKALQEFQNRLNIQMEQKKQQLCLGANEFCTVLEKKIMEMTE